MRWNLLDNFGRNTSAKNVNVIIKNELSSENCIYCIQKALGNNADCKISFVYNIKNISSSFRFDIKIRY